ncbi:hypothetical protein C4D60_Mb01t11770 [Musa balbisiana]|uniref:Uncharacterized protein n=1 Tax=Musa balbisiana TaxID=52838 RepID=A0A4S8JLV3_MUSBA|nr:hypothetical protein C4D60_Mb01t11770 [Musa balbisiana]
MASMNDAVDLMELTSDSISKTTWSTIIEHMRSPSQGGRGGLANTFGCFRGSGGFGADKEETARRLLFLLPLLALLLLADDGGEDKRGVLVAVQRLRKLTYRLFCLSSMHASLPLLRRRWRRRPPRLFLPAPCPEIEKRSFVNTLA